jgi:PAS domain S-box-containing protein
MEVRLPKSRNAVFAFVNVFVWPGLATAIAAGLDLERKPGASVIYVLAVAVSTYLGGVLLGAVSAILSYLGLSYFFVAPIHSLDLHSQSVSGLILFFCATGGVGYMLVRERRAKEHADSLLDETGSLLGRLAASEERLGSIIESSLDGIVVVDERGTVEVFNHASERLFGHSAAAVLGRSISMLMAEPFASEHDAFLRRHLATGEPMVGAGREIVGLRKDGSTFPFELALNEVRLDGRRFFTAIVRDLTDRRRYDEERDRRLDQQRFLARAGMTLFSSLDYEHTLAEVARLTVPKLADWCAIDLRSEDGGIVSVTVAHADPARVDWAREVRKRFPPDPDAPTGVANVLRTGRAELVVDISEEMIEAIPDPERRRVALEFGLHSAMIVPLNARGRALGAISFFLAESGRRYSADDLQFAEELATRAAIAIDNGRLHEAEQAAHASLERLHGVAAALSRAVTLPDALNAILTEGMAASGARAAVVGLADEDGETVDVAAARGYPPETIRRWRSFPVDGRLPLSDVVRTGTAFFCESQADRDRYWPAFVGMGESHAFVALPLAARGRVLGGLALTFDADRSFGADERELLLTIARQCGQALERARLYEREHEIAVAVQRSLLPKDVAVAEEVSIAARYLPASPGLEVGGDWYDVVRVGEDELIVSIGDVVGHGLHAAATMGQLRNAARAYALERASPPEIVRRLNDFVSNFRDGEFSTLFVGRIDLERRTLEYTNAGHPPPLLRGPTGEVAWLDGGRAFPVGVGLDGECTSAIVGFEPNAVLVLYTDGLVERRERPLEEGFAALADVVRKGTEDADDLLEEIIARIVDDDADHTDDIAMVTVTYLPAPEFRLRLDRLPERAGDLRNGLQQWLDELGASPEEAFDVTVACSEAFANAIEHPVEAEASVVDVEGSCAGGELTIAIRDYGRWREHRLREEGGLGLPLMRSLMTSVEVKRRTEGTTVVLRRRLHAAAA